MNLPVYKATFISKQKEIESEKYVPLLKVVHGQAIARGHTYLQTTPTPTCLEYKVTLTTVE